MKSLLILLLCSFSVPLFTSCENKQTVNQVVQLKDGTTINEGEGKK